MYLQNQNFEMITLKRKIKKWIGFLGVIATHQKAKRFQLDNYM
jgi:hypothetical protein